MKNHWWQGKHNQQRETAAFPSSCSTLMREAFVRRLGYLALDDDDPVARVTRSKSGGEHSVACLHRPRGSKSLPFFQAFPAPACLWSPRLSARLGKRGGGRPALLLFFFSFHCSDASQSVGNDRALGFACCREPRARNVTLEIKTLSGGSLGSRVDEERSQLRELM